jgi:hypothetical protein
LPLLHNQLITGGLFIFPVVTGTYIFLAFLKVNSIYPRRINEIVANVIKA